MYKLDLTHHLVLLLGANRGVWKHIDFIYAKKEVEYYKAYKNSTLYGDMAKGMKSTEVESYINKVIGIVMYCRDNDNFEDILYVIKKGYNKLYRGFKNCEKFNVARFIVSVLGEDFIKNNSEHMLYSYIVMMLYLSKILNVELIYMDVEELLGPYIEGFYTDLCSNERTKRIAKENKESIDSLYNLLGIDKKNINKNLIDLNLLLENMIESATLNTIGERFNANGLKAKDMYKVCTPDDYFAVRSELFTKGIYKYIGAFNQWLTVIGLDESDLMSNVLVNEDTFNLILAQIYNSIGAKQLEKGEEAIYFVALLSVYTLAENYKQTKKLYLDNSKDELYNKIALEEEKIAEKEAKIQDDLKKIERMELKHKSDISKLQERIKELESENKSLKKVIKESKNYEKEVVALREYAYEESLKEKGVELITIDEDVDKVDYLSTKNITIIGGHVNWVKNVKAKLPKARFISAGTITRDLKSIVNSDIVVINTTVLDHKLCWRVMEDINNSDVVLVYINTEINVDRVIDKIYSKVVF